MLYVTVTASAAVLLLLLVKSPDSPGSYLISNSLPHTDVDSIMGTASGGQR